MAKTIVERHLLNWSTDRLNKFFSRREVSYNSFKCDNLSRGSRKTIAFSFVRVALRYLQLPCTRVRGSLCVSQACSRENTRHDERNRRQRDFEAGSYRYANAPVVTIIGIVIIR